MDEIGTIVCPRCGLVFPTIDDLYDHALSKHNTPTLTSILEENMPIVKEDFTQIDSSQICIVDGFQLIVSPGKDGKYQLHVHGTVDPLPPPTTTPTQLEWDSLLEIANKFKEAFDVAKRRS